MVDQLAGEVLVDVLDAELALHAGQPLLGDGHGALLLVDLVVLVLALLQTTGDASEVVVRLGRPLAGAGDDERRPRLVDEDGVHLVDDAVVVAPLHLLVGAQHHVVAEIVEAELGVGAVGDVGQVGLAPLGRFHAVLQGGDGEPEELVHRAHPGGVAAGQVVVDGDEVDAAAGQGVEIHRHRGDQGLALAGLHLGDGALVQHDGPHDLHVEGAHAGGALRGLPGHGEGLGHEIVERLSAGEPFSELRGLAAKRGVGERGHLRFEGHDLRHRFFEQSELLPFAEAKDLVNDFDHEKPRLLLVAAEAARPPQPRGRAAERPRLSGLRLDQPVVVRHGGDTPPRSRWSRSW